jgi:hypothetical protein
MAEERNLGLARARDVGDEEPSKEALQRRMEEARDSISNTVTEIKENVAQQVESVKDALDWREHFKKRPVAWSLGAAGVGFFVGYGLAAAISDDDEPQKYEDSYAPKISDSYARPLTGEALQSVSAKTNGKDEGPGLISRFKETSAYERLSKEAGSLGDRVIDELSTTAHTVVLPFLLNKVKELVGLDLSEKPASMAPQQSSNSVSREPVEQSRL